MSGAVQALIGSLRAGDPNWSSVTLLLPGNGTNGAQNNTFIDSSANAFSITRNGNTTQGTFSPFSITPPYSTSTRGGSGYFDGNGDYLSAASNAAFAFGTGDFTAEAWIYRTSAPTYASIYAIGFSVGGFGLAIASNGDVIVTRPGTAIDFTFSAGITTNQWAHVAVTRSGTSFRCFVNGVQIGATATNSTNYAQGALTVGMDGNGTTQPFFGYISNARIVKGTAVYTSNFTPPTAPLTAITNTSLLLNFTNAGIIDNAMLNDLETVGNAQISTAQSKFGGGSMAFDGTGDYLVSNSDANNYAFGSGDFTIEMWVYFAGVASIQCFYDSRPASTQGAYPLLYLNSDGTIRYFVSSADRITSSAVSSATWYHVAVSRSGTSTRMFVNGTQAGSTYTDSTTYLNASGRPWIGISAFNTTQELNGYIDDLRITKGVARYTANFTPPAAAFPTS